MVVDGGSEVRCEGAETGSFLVSLGSLSSVGMMGRWPEWKRAACWVACVCVLRSMLVAKKVPSFGVAGKVSRMRGYPEWESLIWDGDFLLLQLSDCFFNAARTQ
jgi:hypothetical protein